MDNFGKFTSNLAYYYSWRLAEGDNILLQHEQLDQIKKILPLSEEIDIILADARYVSIHQIVLQVQTKHSDINRNITAMIDRIVLHRYFALPIFFMVMYTMFLFAVNLGGVFQDFFDMSTDLIFVQGTSWVLQNLHAPLWTIALVAHGIGQGINTTITFIPVLASMFFALAVLETSGYMARAAFIVDKIMRFLGLPGKSFIPLIVGFGCNVPAIMAARTLNSKYDRLLTVAMSPFMSCSARLAIYTVFVAAFFPTGGQNIVFLLYILGIITAVFTGFVLRKMVFHTKPSFLILELPAYHKPSLQRLLRETNRHLRQFVMRAGRVIIPICVILGSLNILTLDGGISATTTTNSQSALAWFGKYITPFFAPLGIKQDNWPATVSLISGTLAKEVVIGTLSSLYSQIDNFNNANLHFDFWNGMFQAVHSIVENFYNLKNAIANPIVASAPIDVISKSVYKSMLLHFDGQAGAFAYLVFSLLYIPCISTLAAVRQEAGNNLMWFSIIWSFMLAYTMAAASYKLILIFS